MYQSLLSPVLVVTCAWIVTRLAPGVSAFQEATNRVKLACACTEDDCQVPLSASGARTTWSPLDSVPLKAPPANGPALLKRVSCVAAVFGAAPALGAMSAHARNAPRHPTHRMRQESTRGTRLLDVLVGYAKGR